MWYLQLHFVWAKLLLTLFCSCILISSDCVLFFLWLAYHSYFNTIGVFCLVHRLTFFEPRHSDGVFSTKKRTATCLCRFSWVRFGGERGSRKERKRRNSEVKRSVTSSQYRPKACRHIFIYRLRPIAGCSPPSKCKHFDGLIRNTQNYSTSRQAKGSNKKRVCF